MLSFPMLLAGAILAGGCDGTETVGGRAGPPPIREVHAAADEVTVSGPVTKAYGDHVFALGSGVQRVVVVVSTPLLATVGSDVEVTGHMRPFRRSELESELGVELGPQASALENRECLVAASARLA